MRNIFLPQIKNISAHNKVMCGCECCISAKSVHFSLFVCRDNCPKKLKYKSHNAQNSRLGEMISSIFDTYKNDVTPHGIHINKTESEIAMATIFTST